MPSPTPPISPVLPRPDPEHVRRYLTGIRPWTMAPGQTLATTRVLRLATAEVRSRTHPDRGGTFTRIHATDWVNVVPITPDRRVVMVEQWRAGVDEVTLELPGGMTDPGEDPVAAGLRETREETGYALPPGAAQARCIGRVSSNPALFDNWMWTVLMEGVEEVGRPKLDGSEEIRVHLVPLAEVRELIRTGLIHHALVVAAFMHLEVWEAEKTREGPWSPGV